MDKNPSLCATTRCTPRTSPLACGNLKRTKVSPLSATNTFWPNPKDERAECISSTSRATRINLEMRKLTKGYNGARRMVHTADFASTAHQKETTSTNQDQRRPLPLSLTQAPPNSYEPPPTAHYNHPPRILAKTDHTKTQHRSQVPQQRQNG